MAPGPGWPSDGGRVSRTGRILPGTVSIGNAGVRHHSLRHDPRSSSASGIAGTATKTDRSCGARPRPRRRLAGALRAIAFGALLRGFVLAARYTTRRMGAGCFSNARTLGHPGYLGYVSPTRRLAHGQKNGKMMPN